MNIKLQDIGLTQKQLAKKVVEEIAQQLLNPSDEATSQLEQKVQEEYLKQIKDGVDKAARESIAPRVQELLDKTTFQETNRWGESAKPVLTMKEFLVQTAERWMTEQVNYQGKTQAQESYNWSKNGTRISYMIHEHLQYHITNSVKAALSDINSKISTGLSDAVKIQIEECLKKLSVTTKIN